MDGSLSPRGIGEPLISPNSYLKMGRALLFGRGVGV